VARLLGRGLTSQVDDFVAIECVLLHTPQVCTKAAYVCRIHSILEGGAAHLWV
jgi:hypothetical protein